MDSGFFALPDDTNPIDGIQYYRSPNGYEYHYWIIGEYDDLAWTPGCGREIHPFQLEYNEEPIPAGVIPHEPDPMVFKIVETQIAEMEARLLNLLAKIEQLTETEADAILVASRNYQ